MPNASLLRGQLYAAGLGRTRKKRNTGDEKLAMCSICVLVFTSYILNDP